MAAAAVAVFAFGLAFWALSRVHRVERRLAHRSAEAPPLPPAARSLQHVGVVRFNPYHDTGGDYSFAVALLDGTGTGVLFLGLYHRDRCRVYAKPVESWSSSFTLTEEERAAIEQARGRRSGPE